MIAGIPAITHIPLHAFEFNNRVTEGGIVDDPSVSASWKVMIYWKLEKHKMSNLLRETRESIKEFDQDVYNLLKKF